MTDYDDHFDATAPEDSVFADKRALDPLAAPDAIRGRDAQQRALARILGSVTEGYLPPTVAIHDPPGAGKTVTTRRVCREFAARRDDVAVEYVNLKKCRRFSRRPARSTSNSPARNASPTRGQIGVLAPHR